MPIKINQNIFSLLVQRNLAKASEKLESSYEKLSSGQALNRSADNPTAMAASEQIRYQVAGLRQNQQNVSGAVGMIGSAENHVSGMVDLLQRMRELAVQGANDTLNASNRQAIQTEIEQIQAEIERTAASASYGGRRLFDGQYRDVAIQIGESASQTIGVTLGDFRTTSLGARSELRSPGGVPGGALPVGQLFIGGVEIGASSADGVSTTAADASAVAKARAINAAEGRTGVHAEALPTEVRGNSAIQAANLNGTSGRLWINGVAIHPVAVSAEDAGGALVRRINNSSTQTGVTASVGSANELVLTAADGRNIQVRTEGSVGDELGLRSTDGDVDQFSTAAIEIYSTRAFTLHDASGTLGMGTLARQVNPDPTTALAQASVLDSESAGRTIRSVDAALEQLADARSMLGAVQNRLDGLTDSLAGQVQELTGADSRLRDTDFALETARLTQAQILQEAAVAMLAQANVAPRRALELLQG